MHTRTIHRKRLLLALTLGGLVQAALLALSLHAGLGIAEICSASLACFWLLNGLYFVIGLAVVLLVVPWADLLLRIGIFCGLVIGGLALGLLSTP